MVKTPSTRHSKSGREPVTIDQEASEAKIAAATGDGGPFEGSPSGSASSFDETVGTDLAGHPARSPATRLGETHSMSGAEQAEVAPLSSEPSATDDLLIHAHADAPVLRDEGPAQSTTEMLHADRPDDDNGPASAMSDAASSPTYESGSDYTTPASSGSSSEPQTTPVQSMAEAAPARRGAGFGSLLAAGLIGGALALGGSMVLDRAGVMEGPVANSTGNADVEALRADVAELQARPQTGGDPELAKQIEQLRTDMAAVQQTSTSGAAAADLQALSARVDELGTQLGTLSQAGTPDAQPVDLAPIAGRLDGLEQSLRTVEQAAEQSRTASEQRVAEMQQSLDAMGRRLEERVNDPRLALAITASALKAAIDRGQPFQTEFDAYAAAAPQAAQVEALRGMAASGVPTRAEIADEMAEATSAMVAAAKPAPDNGGMVARLWSSATNLVEVRPVGGDVQGNEPGAVVARLEAAVQSGDYAKALAEFDALPEPAKAAGADFAAKLRARQTADDLVSTALSEALKA